MGIHSEKAQEKKNHSSVSEALQVHSDGVDSLQFVDNRSETVAQRKIQDVVDKSAQISQLKSIQLMANNSPRVKYITQLQAISDNSSSKQQPIQKEENNTGLPDNLKTGMENLSGLPLDDVSVHRASDKPAQLQAHAYAQGTDIHLAPGQEKHLPHEAWHVVQQKQGRVKPTKQLVKQSASPNLVEKSKLEINDDGGLEHEADVMGAKALDMAFQGDSIISEIENTIGDTAQLQKDEKVYDVPASLENEVDPKSKEHKKKLEDLKKSGASMGEESQIDLQGELTTVAKINRFFGNESTYSKLLKKVDDFNKSKDVTEKQSLLKDLKPLARTWLERHDAIESSDGKQDKNEGLKRESVSKFLNQTTSNYPTLIEKYKELQISMESFIGDPINNRNIFYQSVGDYATLLGLVEIYKSTYPPSVNLLYLSELEMINAADNELTKSGLQSGPTFDTNLGFSINEVEASFNLTSGEYMFTGNLVISFPGIITSDGSVTVKFNSDDTFNNITVDGKSCKFEMNGIVFEMSNFNYDYNANEFIAEEASGSLEVLDRTVTLKAFDTSIKGGTPNFSRLEGDIDGVFDTNLGMKITAPKVKYFRDNGIEVEGVLGLGIEDIANVEGWIGLRLDHTNTIESIEIKDGKSDAAVDGITLELNGINYDYSAQKFTIEKASGTINIFDNVIVLTVSGLSIVKDKFDYEKIEGELPDIDYGFFSLKKTSISFSKESKAFTGNAAYQFNTKESPVGFTDFDTSGDVQIYWSPAGDKYYSIDNGTLKFKLFGQQVEANNFSFESKEQKISVEDLNLNLGLKDFKKTFTGKNIEISKAGIAFEELKTEASGHEFNVKIFSLKPKEYKIVKDKNGGLKVMAVGSMSLSLPDYLGIKSEGEIGGDVGLNFNQSSPDYHITSGKAEIKMPNPLNKINEILGDNWSSSRYELSATIPVYPGVSAIFGLYIQYGGQFAQEIGAVIELDENDNSIIFHATTNLKAQVEGGVFGGIQGGSQLLIALALLLRAAGKFDMNTEIGYTKNFPLEQQPTEVGIKKDTGFTYNIQGDAKVAVYIDIVATALYFFRKQFNLELGEKSLGEFEFSNTKKSDPDMGETALASREDLEKQIEEPSLKEEAKGLTIEQLLDIDSNHRFKAKEKKETINVIKAAEGGRLEAHTNSDEPGKFNNIALANLQFYNQFIDERCNWDKIYNMFDSIGSFLPESVLKTHADKGEKYLREDVFGSIKNLGESINIAQAFVTHYNEKVAAYAESYPIEIISSYHVLLLRKSIILQDVENMKKDYLHSSFFGDESKQLANIKTGAWFGSSKYEQFAAAYSAFRTSMIANKNVLDAVAKVGRETSFKLVQDHQRKIENNAQ